MIRCLVQKYHLKKDNLLVIKILQSVIDNFFTNRIIDICNNLPPGHVVDASSINSFKNKMEHSTLCGSPFFAIFSESTGSQILILT